MLHINLYITLYILMVVFILGAIMGSFVNCLAYRIAEGGSALKGRSHCTSCGHTLHAPDLVPIFSYIFLRGKCRYCGQHVSMRYFGSEILMALIFTAIIVKLDVTPEAIRYLVLSCILMGLSIVDIEKYEIPDRFIIAGILWWAVTIPFMEEPWSIQLKTGAIGGFSVAIAMLLLSIIFDKITGKESLGGGDVKLFFVAGLYLGVLVSLLNLIISCIVGILFVVFMKQKRIPFGPAISIAVIISVLAGQEIVNWYISLL